jgi:hypothetical protein
VAVLTDVSYRLWFIRIVAVGFILRLAWALRVSVEPISDSTVYDQLAWSLAERGAYAWGNGDITAY